MVEEYVPVQPLAALGVDVGRFRRLLLGHVGRIYVVRPKLTGGRLLRPRSVGRQVLANLILYPVPILHTGVVGVLVAADAVATAAERCVARRAGSGGVVTDMVTIEQEPGDITQGRREELRGGGGAARQRALTSWWRLLCSREGGGRGGRAQQTRNTRSGALEDISESSGGAVTKESKFLMDGPLIQNFLVKGSRNRRV